MKKSKAAIVTSGLIAAAAFALPAAAEGEGFYIGASLGQATQKDACSGLGGTGVTCEDTDTAWRLLGGYQFNRNFAAELGYHELGKSSARLGSVSAQVKASAWELVGVGTLPLANQFSLYGKVGVYSGKLSGTSNVGVSASDSNSDLTFGVGAQYDVSKNLGLRLEYQKYSDMGGNNVGTTDVDVISLGAIWRF